MILLKPLHLSPAIGTCIFIGRFDIFPLLCCKIVYGGITLCGISFTSILSFFFRMRFSVGRSKLSMSSFITIILFASSYSFLLTMRFLITSFYGSTLFKIGSAIGPCIDSTIFKPLFTWKLTHVLPFITGHQVWNGWQVMNPAPACNLVPSIKTLTQAGLQLKGN